MTNRDSPPNPLALEEQVCYALVVASRSIVALYRPILEPLGLTHPQYLVMLALWSSEPRSVKNLSEELQLDSATLSPLLKRLESMGHISRRRSASDERVLEIQLTERGRALRADALPVPHAVRSQLRVLDGELVQLRTSLRRIIDATRTAPDSASDPV